MGRVVVAPDKFKGSLTAVEVASHVATGLRTVASTVDIVELPVADGGEGTLAAATAAGFTRIAVDASGPTGVRVATAYARRGDVAVVELADICGLGRLPGAAFAAMTASSRGLGEVVAAALDAGCRQIVIGLGGSASTDGGAGMVAALGARLLSRDGEPVADGGGALRDAASLDLTGLHPGLASVEIVLASDVDNPLLGPAGAAAVYGPQKGATTEQVADLEAGLAVWADLAEIALGDVHRLKAAHRSSERELPGAGAAGGVGFAAVALLGAVRRPGIDVVLDLVGFADRLPGADLVVTGEGSLDPQSLRGKAPMGVAAAAAAAGVPTVAVCGRLALSEQQVRDAGLAGAYSLGSYEPDPQRSMAQAGPLLERVGRQIAIDYLTSQDAR
jgi:glycerate kinase